MEDETRAGPGGLVEHFFRHEYGRLVSTLARVFGVQSIDRVEDAVQGALLLALHAWADKGPPDDPAGWLYRVAHNQLIDSVRRDASWSRRAPQVLTEHVARHPDGSAATNPTRFAREIQDDQLRMLFVCCDDAIPIESQLVLALKTLCGFSTSEIALRLLTSEANVHKRLARARERLRGLPRDLETPPVEALAARLGAVHAALYLLFNEGFHSTQADRPVRRELCDEAARLALLLVEHPVGDHPATRALLALMYLHAARLEARGEDGGLLLLADQDRGRWDRELIDRGLRWLMASAEGETFTRYHAEAGIAAEHCLAPSFAATRWSEIVDLYARLERLSPSPLHTLNRAVALAQCDGPEAGLALLATVQVQPWLSNYYLWDAVLGELHRQAAHTALAEHHLQRAIDNAPTDGERALLGERLRTLAAR